MSFEDKLIIEVRNRPILWDKRRDDYKNRLKSDREWGLVARSLNKTSEYIFYLLPVYYLFFYYIIYDEFEK